MKQDVQIHVKLDTYVKLSELKARLRRKSFDEVIKELIKVFEASVASATDTTSVAVASKTGADVASATTASPATSVADPSYRLIDRSEGGGIVVEVSDGEPKTIDGGSSDSGDDQNHSEKR